MDDVTPSTKRERIARLCNAQPATVFQIKVENLYLMRDFSGDDDEGDEFQEPSMGLCQSSIICAYRGGRSWQVLDLKTGTHHIVHLPGGVQGDLISTTSQYFVIKCGNM